MIASRPPRWLISFTDLILLLLGFFVLLYARRDNPAIVTNSLHQAFKESGATNVNAYLDANEVFETGEAVLTSAGKTKILSVFRQGLSKNRFTISSKGMDQGSQRFDAWELSAARTAAVARALKQLGILENRLEIMMERTSKQKLGQGQTIEIIAK
jgi:hypothetical protein